MLGQEMNPNGCPMNPRRPISPMPSRAPSRRFSLSGLAFSALVLMFCGMLGFGVTVSAVFAWHSVRETDYEVLDVPPPMYAQSALGPQAAAAPLSSVFTPEVQYWAPLIRAWAQAYQIDPNLIATLIQIESCGDPYVTSSAGAQGLFQVMPFHFEPGEDMLEPHTNARRGLDYLLGSLQRADGHVGLALAGYNGGHSVIWRGWAAWSEQTRRYYRWGTGIYFEAISGAESSPTLQEWFAVGGMRLCANAARSLEQLQQEQADALR